MYKTVIIGQYFRHVSFARKGIFRETNESRFVFRKKTEEAEIYFSYPFQIKILDDERLALQLPREYDGYIPPSIRWRGVGG